MKVMIKIMVLLLTIGLFGCASETPKEAAEAILELHKEGDYETLANERFARIAEVKDEGKMDQVVDRLKRLLADKEKTKTAISFYQAAVKSEYKIEENNKYQKKGQTGRLATFDVEFDGKKRTFKLYEMENGKWGMTF